MTTKTARVLKRDQAMYVSGLSGCESLVSIRESSLYSTRLQNWSQRRDFRTGVTCQDLEALTTRAV